MGQKKYRTEIMNSEFYNKEGKLDIDLRGAHNKRLDDVLKGIYNKHKEFFDDRNSYMEDDIHAEHESAYTTFANGVKEKMEEGNYSLKEALNKELNSSWWTDYGNVSRRNFITGLKKDSEVMNTVRKSFGWQKGNDFLNGLQYDPAAAAELGVQAAYSFMGVVIYVDNSPKDGTGGGFKVLF